MLIEIKHRFTGAVLFPLECGSLKLCVEAAVKSRADLRDWFAGQESECPEFSIETAEALAGYKCPNIDNRLAYAKWVAAWKAKWRYISADAMIAERNKS